ncbi:MAG: TspO/MBR family protein [Fuscovulum sp.]|jgi:benzodiazapine receptor|nr:tryptophan-rich sensory protein [Paracoccaceae bacterium]MCZ8083119.1 tryptophan-rich sensory protein [Paracoccaceae bacterium]WRH64607.1 MAG: TspO/MBR family protein [Fuscovulum sp.]
MEFFTLFLTYLAACGAAAATGALFQPGDWYRSLNKPRWTPPDWLFPVAWTVLYLCMSTAAARVAMIDGTGQALALWSVQIALNALWTPVFFGLRRLGAGLVIIFLLWLAVAATMLAFWQVDWIAGLLFAPYLLWVSIAGALNRSVWVRNPVTA